jgi:glycosyltransferase involved in cell wall biosynthesis
MRVLQVTHYMPPHHGGIERVADVLFGGYRRAGLDVLWFASRVPRDAREHEPGKRRVPCLNIGEARFGVPVTIWGPRAVRELAQSVRWADVVHVHDCQYPGSAFAIRFARRYGRPSLLTQHIGLKIYRSAILNGVQHAVYATMGRAALRGASRLTFATPTAEAHVRDLLRVLPADACAIPNGMDLGRFTAGGPAARRDARRALGIPEDRAVALFAGRLVERKGLPLLLDVARRTPDAIFVIAGDGPLSSLLVDAPVNIRWSRSIPHAEMPVYYRAADCLLLLSEGEGFPLVVQEALASGLIPIVSDREGYARPLADAGLVESVSPEIDAVAQAIQRLHAVDAERSAAARRYAVEHWDADAMVRRYVGILRDLANVR